MNIAQTCARYLGIGVLGLNYKHDTYSITFTHGIHTNSDNNNKKCVMRKEKRVISFNKTSLQKTPMFQKIIMVKKKKNNNNIETKTKQKLAQVAYFFGLVLAPPSES